MVKRLEVFPKIKFQSGLCADRRMSIRHHYGQMDTKAPSARTDGEEECQASSSEGVLAAAVRPTDRRVVNNFLLLRMGVHRITKNKYVNVDLGVKR